MLCKRAGLVRLGHVALDGTKLKANASKHKAMSYGRIVDKEKELAEGKKTNSKEEKQKVKPHLISSGKPDLKVQYNFHRSRFPHHEGCFKQGLEQGYNCQTAVDGHSQVIIAADVSTYANDKNQIEPRVDKIEANLNMLPILLTADSSYFSSSNIEYLTSKTIDPYIATRCIKHSERQGPSFCGPIPDDVGTKRGWSSNCARLRVKISIPNVKKWWNRCLVRLNMCVDFASFSCEAKKNLKASGYLSA